MCRGRVGAARRLTNRGERATRRRAATTPNPPPPLQRTAKDLYLVTDRDLARLGFVERKNPHGAGWAPMRLFLEAQVAAAAATRHGPGADLDAERTARVEARLTARAGKRAAAEKREREGGAKVARARAALDAREVAARGDAAAGRARAEVEHI